MGKLTLIVLQIILKDCLRISTPGTDEPLKNLFDKIDDTVSHHDLEVVDKVTPDLIKKIVKEKNQKWKN